MRFFTSLRRHASLLLLLLVSALAARAQNIAIKGDVITVDKKPYAKLKKSGSMLMRDFLLTTLDDKEVMLAKGNLVSLPNNEREIYYSLTFRPGGEVAEMSSSGLNFAQHLADALVQQGVMRDGQPDPEGIARFVKAYSEKFSEKLAKEKEAQLNVPPLKYMVVERSRSRPVVLENNRKLHRTDIFQDGKLIGYLGDLGNVKDRASWDVHLPDGLVVADFAVDSWMSAGSGTMTYKILVKRDNTYHDKSAAGGVEACRQNAVEYLVYGGLL